MTNRQLFAGVSRVEITPLDGVELTGWGYYLNRVWREVHDPLYATAMVVGHHPQDVRQAVAILTLDLMVVDELFTLRVRERVAQQTGIPASSVLLTCSHSHNAPAAGGLLGVGECSSEYERWAADQAAEAIHRASSALSPVCLRVASTSLPGLTFNRTRDAGLTDHQLTVCTLDRDDGSPLVSLINFAGHPTVSTELRPYAVSRDVPGEICDAIELARPGSTAMYIQGACGDTNFLREFQTSERCHEPATAIAQRALELLADAAETSNPIVCGESSRVALPTRRWQSEEIEHDRVEASRRLHENDIDGWRDSIGRVMTNRPDDMVKRHGGDEHKAVMAMCRFNMEWTDRILADVETRPELLETEVQAIRLGDLRLQQVVQDVGPPHIGDGNHGNIVRLRGQII